MSRIAIAAVLAGILSVGGTSGARAQQPTSFGPQAATASRWMFDLTPYAWFASINANVNFNLPPELGGTVSASPSIGFGDLLSHVNIGFMGAVDVAQSCALLAGWHPVRSTPDDESFRRVVNG